MKIKFIKACDGYAVGEVLDVDAGIADAFVTYRCAAAYVKEPATATPFEQSRQDKMMREGKVKRK